MIFIKWKSHEDDSTIHITEFGASANECPFFENTNYSDTSEVVYIISVEIEHIADMKQPHVVIPINEYYNIQELISFINKIIKDNYIIPSNVHWLHAYTTFVSHYKNYSFKRDRFNKHISGYFKDILI